MSAENGNNKATAGAPLVVENLRILAGKRVLVHDVSLRVHPGEIVALVGASGSGKSVTARGILDLLRFTPGCVGGSVMIAGERARRGHDVGLIAQDARASLDPLLSVGRHVASAAQLAFNDAHTAAGSSGALLAMNASHALPHLARAGFTEPERVAGLFAHQLSGGMAQRAAIAIALARAPRFVIADEPTTGLDPTVQVEILSLVRRLAHDGLGVLFITHDLRILPHFADRILVMAEGRIVEEAASPAQLAGAGRPLVAATERLTGVLA